MTPIILAAETGSDITPELVSKYGIRIVPMHVTFDNETLDDGSFPPDQIRDYSHQTGRLPKTSGSTLDDFMKIFDEIHEEQPEAQILYLAYSAVTTCSYQSAQIAAEGRDYITAIDTKQVSVGQAARESGFKEVRWIQAAGVITTHGGPAAFGMAGLSVE